MSESSDRPDDGRADIPTGVPAEDVRRDEARTEAYPATAPEDGARSATARRRGDSFFRRRRGLLIPFVAVGAACALVGGALGAGIAIAANPGGAITTSTTTQGSGVVINNPSSATTVSAVAAKASPSVVTISVTASQESGTGSGIVLTSDGYVLTNNHVVTLDGDTAGGTISVTTSNGRIYKASVVKTDPLNDLAVIKLQGASGLTKATFADSSDLNVGDTVVAIGAPLDLPNTVTTGIVSALNRSISVQSSAVQSGSGDDSGDGSGSGSGESPFNFWDFGDGSGSGSGGTDQSQQQSTATSSIYLSVLQTDAAINPGNSGGALLDSRGRVIGVNVAIAGTGSTSSSSQSGSIGVGFAIPSNVAERIAEQLMAGKTVTHGQLGVESPSSGSTTTGSIAGVEVSTATAGGPAAKAGIAKGDVITAVGGVPVTDYTSLAGQVRTHAGGSTVPVTYVRNGTAHTVQVVLGTVKA